MEELIAKITERVYAYGSGPVESRLSDEVMYEMTKIIGWKYGTMFSWNFIVTKAEH